MSAPDETTFFPSTVEEAIAFLYVQNQDLKGKDVKEIMAMYAEALRTLLDR